MQHLFTLYSTTQWSLCASDVIKTIKIFKYVHYPNATRFLFLSSGINLKSSLLGLQRCDPFNRREAMGKAAHMCQFSNIHLSRKYLGLL
jgi:hypothetical protein